MAEPRTEIVDNVNSPKHYTECSLECIEVMQVAFGVQATFNFCILNAFKYLWRYDHKNGLEDIRKARWYLQRADYLVDNFDGYHFGTDKLEMLQDLWAQIVDEKGVGDEI